MNPFYDTFTGVGILKDHLADSGEAWRPPSLYSFDDNRLRLRNGQLSCDLNPDNTYSNGWYYPNLTLPDSAIPWTLELDFTCVYQSDANEGWRRIALELYKVVNDYNPNTGAETRGLITIGESEGWSAQWELVQRFGIDANNTFFPLTFVVGQRYRLTIEVANHQFTLRLNGNALGSHQSLLSGLGTRLQLNVLGCPFFALDQLRLWEGGNVAPDEFSSGGGGSAPSLTIDVQAGEWHYRAWPNIALAASDPGNLELEGVHSNFTKATKQPSLMQPPSGAGWPGAIGHF